MKKKLVNLRDRLESIKMLSKITAYLTKQKKRWYFILFFFFSNIIHMTKMSTINEWFCIISHKFMP